MTVLYQQLLSISSSSDSSSKDIYYRWVYHRTFIVRRPWRPSHSGEASSGELSGE